MRLTTFIFVSFWLISLQAQLVAESNLCISENLDLIHDSSSNIIWDFCGFELEESPTINSKSTISLTRSNEIKIVYDSISLNYFGFLIDYGAVSNDALIRLNYGNSLNNTPSVVSMTLSGDGLNDPDGLDIIKTNNGNWIGFVGSVQSNHGITRLNFGSSLFNQPSAENIGNFNLNDRVRALRVLDNRYLVLLGYSSKALNIVDFGNGFDNPPISSFLTSSFPKLSNAGGMDIKKINGKWIALVISINDARMLRLNFGNNLLSNPIEEKVYNLGTTGFYKVKWVVDNNHYALLSNFNSGPSLLKLNDFELASSFNHVSLGGSQSYSVDLVYSEGAYHGTYLPTSDKILRHFLFNSFCGETLPYSNGNNPIVSFSIDGSKEIKKFKGGLVQFETLTINSNRSESASFLISNQCATASSSFTPFTTGLTYSWDFDEDGVEDSNLEHPSFAFGTPGTYTVRLDVDDGTCHNFTTQDITLYEEPPVPAFTVTGDLCTTTSLSFGNTTNDAAYAGPLSYTWDFNGEGSSNVKSPSFAFATPGTKTVTLTSSIPGCENVTQQVIEVVAGPMAAFSSNASCQGDLMSFTNNSAGADTYLWDFGDGFTSTLANPSHVYTSGGNYTVTLSATETGACTTILQQQVSVAYLPTAEFDYDVPCSGSQGIDFYDFSFAAGADIVAWSWYVDDVFVTNDREPTISFDEAGTHDIRLEVLSSRGCSSSLEKSIEVLGAPVPSFSAEVNCQSQTSIFTDTTPGTVISRLWSINGQTYTTANPSHVFASAGTFNVSLMVTSSDFCTSTTSSMVTVRTAPVMSFSLSSLCAGDEILITDNSTSTDPIVSRTWTLDGNPFFNGAQALLTNATPGAHTLALQVQTASGCSFTTSQNVTLLASPVAGFTSTATAGVPPFPVTFTNTSTGATGYVWRVNGSQVSTSANLTQVFSELGNQVVELTATKANGCQSITSTTISSVTPAVDLQVRDVQVITNGTSSNVTVTIGNEGNLPIEIFDLIVRTGNDSQVSERFNSYIGTGEEVSVGFSTDLQMGDANRLCVSVVSAYSDISPDDNDACINYSSHIILERPYPNPITDQATFRLILPSEKSVQLTVTHVSGRMLINEQFNDLSEGLHILRYDASQWKKGIYLVTVRSGSDVVTRKVVVD